MHKRYLTLVLCCGAVAVAGCGSSNSSNSGTGAITAPPNGAVFSADLNALCKQGNTAAAKVKSNPQKFLQVINSYLPKFRALTASGSQQAVYNKFLANVQAEANDLKSGNLQGAQAANTRNNALATQLHAPACGSGA
jgi:spermidine/putrescine-binding protein